ncbi:MAG: BlaI/MecI/CopY family transcriptional regulator [Candidatus Omnitrophica bacterium]|nr:BlaI/MecI/CopY family transcriptional regulator [Candidatus Omnitrophota bacterium]
MKKSRQIYLKSSVSMPPGRKDKDRPLPAAEAQLLPSSDLHHNREDTLPRITPAEWEVMLLLWDKGELSSSEIDWHLALKKGWKAYTSRTLLRRLFRKGAVTCDRTRRPAIYRAGLLKESYMREQSRLLLHRVFKGATASFLIALLKEAPLTKNEIQEIKRTIEEKENQ